MKDKCWTAQVRKQVLHITLDEGAQQRHALDAQQVRQPEDHSRLSVRV